MFIIHERLRSNQRVIIHGGRNGSNQFSFGAFYSSNRIHDVQVKILLSKLVAIATPSHATNSISFTQPVVSSNADEIGIRLRTWAVQNFEPESIWLMIINDGVSSRVQASRFMVIIVEGTGRLEFFTSMALWLRTQSH